VNCLIVDALNEGRTDPLVAYLRMRHHHVVEHCDQLTLEPGDPLPSEVWRHLVHEKDIVFLHIGEQQRHSKLFFKFALAALPVFCYSGDEPPDDIALACRARGARVVCPESFGRSRKYGDRLLGVALRWLGPIESRNDPERFVEAWQNIRDLDMVKEERLASLDNQLVATLAVGPWTGAHEITDELRFALEKLAAERRRWGI
jgi:hypothetical protein